MHDEKEIPWMKALPEDATHAVALAWLKRIRRLLNRWEDLPDHSSRSITPDFKAQEHEELKVVEDSIRRNMAWAQDA